jgi:hypothetical protein
LKTTYVYDASALIADIKAELGANIVGAAYKETVDGDAELIINRVNLLEVYYEVVCS